MEEGSKLTIFQEAFLNYGLITAKKLILKFWKNTTTPTFKMWISNMSETLHLEEMRFLLLGKVDQFLKTWSPFIDFLQAYGAT